MTTAIQFLISATLNEMKGGAQGLDLPGGVLAADHTLITLLAAKARVAVLAADSTRKQSHAKMRVFLTCPPATMSVCRPSFTGSMGLPSPVAVNDEAATENSNTAGRQTVTGKI
jgi:hypothetical protein